MSVSGISSSNLFDSSKQTIQNNIQQFQKEFQQLGQDLQSGNLSAAQSDFVTLQQLGPQGNSSSASTSAAQSNSPIAQAFNQLAQDLKSGNISGAQQDFAQIQRAFRISHRKPKATITTITAAAKVEGTRSANCLTS